MIDSLEMLRARRLVEDHIRAFGMVPHPDRLKEAIAAALKTSAAPSVTLTGKHGMDGAA